jgi:hypothetical protein
MRVMDNKIHELGGVDSFNSYRFSGYDNLSIMEIRESASL